PCSRGREGRGREGTRTREGAEAIDTIRYRKYLMPLADRGFPNSHPRLCNLTSKPRTSRHRREAPMSIRTVLLHAAPDSGFDDRLAFAVALARQSGAALKAIYTLYPAGVPRVGRALSIYVNELVHEARQKEAGLKARFEQAAAGAG